MCAMSERAISPLPRRNNASSKIEWKGDAMAQAHPEGPLIQLNRKSGGHKIHPENSDKLIANTVLYNPLLVHSQMWKCYYLTQNAPLRYALSERAIIPLPRRNNASSTIEGKGDSMTYGRYHNPRLIYGRKYSKRLIYISEYE